MKQIDPNDFRLKWSQIALYFIVTGLLVVLFIMYGMPAWSAGFMALGIMLLLIVAEYAIVAFLKKRNPQDEE